MKSFVILFLFLHSSAYGGFEPRSMGARCKALGGASSALSGDAWSAVTNPASLTALTSNQFSLYYSPQPFGVHELSSGALAIGLPTAIGAFGFSGSRYGFDLYKEVTVSCSYAAVISKLSLGVNVAYDDVSIQNYGSAGTMNITAGLFSKITSLLHAGLVIRNITSSTIGVPREKLPQIFSAGLSCFPIPEVNLVLDYEKQIGFDPSPRFGLEYKIVESVALRGGISEEPNLSSGGIGIQYSFMQFDYALSYNETLGWSHEISLTIIWGGRHE